MKRYNCNSFSLMFVLCADLRLRVLQSVDPGQQFTWENSNLEVNKPKNRYANVIAYDHSRVILSSIEGKTRFRCVCVRVWVCVTCYLRLCMATVMVSGNEAILVTFSGPIKVYDLVAELWFGLGFKLGMKL